MTITNITSKTEYLTESARVSLTKYFYKGRRQKHLLFADMSGNLETTLPSILWIFSKRIFFS